MPLAFNHLSVVMQLCAIARSRSKAPNTMPAVKGARGARRQGGLARWNDLSVFAQRMPRISEPGDPLEKQADSIADTVVRAPEPIVQRKCAGCASGAKSCPECEEESAIQRQEKSGAPVSTAPGIGDAIAPGAGSPLEGGARHFFESRLGRNFGDVRIHDGARADAAARALNARAFTVGSNVVFASGEYRPASEPGRRLLAHELVHVLQQRELGRKVQRKVTVDPNPPTDPQDPLSSMSASAFQSLAFSDMDTTINALCDAFSVDASGQVVSSPADFCTDESSVAGGAKKVGCCCLCALTKPGSGDWTIKLTAFGGPRTQQTPSGGEFFLHPRTSDFDFGAWSVGGTRDLADPVIVAGHELCGHGALLERGVHPANVERVDTDVHDPTVRIENLLRAEQGLTSGDRALAAGSHRGESFAVITVRKFGFNSASVASLPSAERAKIQLAKDFINASDSWVDVFGHSDLVGSAPAKLGVSRNRAFAVVDALTKGSNAVSTSISKTFTQTGAAGTGTVTVAGNRFTHIEGRSDFDAIPGAAPEDLRRVEIFMAGRPAGAEVAPPGTPTNVEAVLPEFPLTTLFRGFFGSPCDELLTRSAWNF
jgi:hypothetical protein